MIGKVAIHISEEDHSYLNYVKSITLRLGSTPDFIYLEGEYLLNFIKPSEEKQLAIRKHIEEFFDDYQLYTFFDKDDSTLDHLQESYDLLFVKYKKQFFGKSMPEWLLMETDNIRLWVYKNGGSAHIKRVCLPVDFSERSIRQVEFVEYLKNFFDFNYDLVYAMNMGRLKEKLSKKDYDKSLLDKREEVMHLYTDMFAEKKLNLTVLEGDPYKEMVKYINSSGYDLVVIGRRGKGMRERIGSVSLHMARSLKCPVVVL